jgi:hypothetical protein
VEALPGKVIGSTRLNDGKWHQLAVVVADENGSGSTFTAETRIHVDGILDPLSSVISTLVSTDAGTNASLGGTDASSNSNFNGNLDEVRIFPRALAASEVQALYQNNLNTALASLPPGDTDGDGVTDAAEEIAGTDPNDATSYFRIHDPVQTGGGMTLRWAGVAGRTYRVEESSALSNWTLVPGVAPVVVTENTPNASVTVPANGAPKRFLRMQVMLTQ